MRGPRRFSQAISEGDGISLLVEVADVPAARAAEEAGAEGLIVRGDVEGLREATGLPVVWCAGDVERARSADVDAFLLVGASEALADDAGRLYGAALATGLDCVVEVRDEDELRLVLDRLDPETLLLSARRAGGDPLEHVLGLLPDVPAGKLAIADLGVSGRREVDELERAGVDGVVVAAASLDELVRAARSRQ